MRASPADRTQTVDMTPTERGNHIIQRIPNEQTQVSRAGRRPVRLEVNLMARLMNIDLLSAELHRQTPIAERLHPHAQHITVKRACRIDIPHCDDQMIQTSDSHSINPIAEQPKRQPRRSQAKKRHPGQQRGRPIVGYLTPVFYRSQVCGHTR